MVMAAPSTPAARPAIHVLIVDQRLAFRDALATRLQTEPDLAVVAKAHSAKFAPRVLVGRSADVILLDADLPDDSAIAFCSDLTQSGDQSRVVMVSAVSQPERIVAAVRAGAAAWVRKDESVDHLLRVIRGVVRGDTWVPPRELGAVLRLLIEDQDRRRDGDDLLSSLTRRERDVLFLLVEGAGRKEIAERLQLSANTVRTHLHSLMVKFGVHSTLEVVTLARPRLDAFSQIRLSTIDNSISFLLTRFILSDSRHESVRKNQDPYPERARGDSSAPTGVRAWTPRRPGLPPVARDPLAPACPSVEAAQSRWRSDVLRRMRVFRARSGCNIDVLLRTPAAVPPRYPRGQR
jgi:DNA-binding NarL/FixJ family response regulator